MTPKAPHVMHQNVGSLTTTQCLRLWVPAAVAASWALADHAWTARPRQDCGASRPHVMDFDLHVVHHHPKPFLCSVCPPFPGFLALVVECFPVCGLTSVGRTRCCCCLSFRFVAAASAAFAREACVSLSGSPVW